MNKEQFEHLESGVWQAVEARRKGRDKQQEQRRQAKQGERTEQEQSKQGKQVQFGEAGEDGSGKRRRTRCDYGQAEEVQASSKVEMRGIGRTRPAGKAKGKVTEEKANMKAKEEDLAAKDSSRA